MYKNKPEQIVKVQTIQGKQVLEETGTNELKQECGSCLRP
jgi:hypothetical protein